HLNKSDLSGCNIQPPEMKILVSLSLFLLSILLANAQVMIHSHNDYVHAKPFWEAYQADAYSIEADIYLRENNLMVAHASNEIKTGVTLEKLYLEPLTKVILSKMKLKSGGNRSMPVMLIDFKDDYQKVMPVFLAKLLDMQNKLKEQRVDTMPTFVVSGNRPPADSFGIYPYYVQFDGRPYELYDKAALSKIAFISDQYLKYSSWNGKEAIAPADSATIVRLIQTIHEKGKMLRLWNTPDTELAWKTFREMGVDIINTDQPAICQKFFSGS
ncbi:MAG: hypothetical protein ABI151_04565, partial [Chitinophagaceae bacterium]